MKKVYRMDTGGVDWVVAESAAHALEVWMKYTGTGEEYRQYYDASHFVECPDDETLEITFTDIGDAAEVGLLLPDEATTETDEDGNVTISATCHQWADSNEPCFLCSTEY